MPLLLLTLLGFALAAFFAVLAWRLARQEQLRSAARVAALSDAIDDHSGETTPGGVQVHQEFLAHQPASAPVRGVIRLAVGFAVTVAVIITVAMLGSNRAPRPDAATTVAPSELELLSMRHQREGDSLTVTGLVRNGGSGAAERLIAVVFAFDRGGNFVTSGRAPLEFLSLAPGDESPFRVSVPDAGDVGRYRVSFRTETGVVRHVDKRQALIADGGSAAQRPPYGR